MKREFLSRVLLGLAACIILLGASASAQLLDRKAISLVEAKKIAAASHAEAAKNKWNVVIAIVDETGNLIYLERIDEAQVASIGVAIGKARTAATFKRPTKAFEDAVAGGRNVILNLSPDIVPVQGGIPLMGGGRVIGAIGVSGVTGDQDSQIAAAGAALLK